MRDPHIVSLTYRLIPAPNVTINEPSDITRETDLYKMDLVDNVLTITLKQHYADVASAQGDVGRWLKSWEIKSGLENGGVPQISFEYEDAEIFDRNPPELGEPVVARPLAANLTMTICGNVTASIERNHYPPPPEDFHADDELVALWDRYQLVREGKEPLQTFGYYLVTVLEARFSGRNNTAASLNVSSKVLRKMGELCTEHGDELTVRKKVQKVSPFTATEQKWTEIVIRQLVERLGCFNAGHVTGLPQITLADLPAL